MSEHTAVPKQTLSTPALTARQTGVLQRQCACGTHTVAGGECESCRREKASVNVHRAAISVEPVNEVPTIVHEVLRSPGQPLEATVREFMESRFDHDFSRVRVHSDAKAAESAHKVNALAYTVGSDVIFANGQYAPHTSTGRKLLTHELTHVVQQGFGKSGASALTLSNTSDHETEASKIANDLAANPSQVRVPSVATGNILARQKESDEIPKIGRSFELDPNIFIKPMDAPAEREEGPFSCPPGYKDLGAFKLTAYVLAQESEFPATPTVKDPCGLTGTFRETFLFQTSKSPRGVKMQGSGRSLGGDTIHYAGDECFEVLDCPETKSRTCATSGRTVAVDKAVIKLGSELIIEGIGKRVAEDTGGKIKGNHIDIYYGTNINMAEALKRTLTGKKVCRKLVK